MSTAGGLCGPDPDDPIRTVATWQCLQRKRLEKFKPSHHKLIIVDECHHACAAG